MLVESPTYPGALDAVRAHGCVPVGVPIGPDGWDLALMRAALRDARPRLGYLIPDFQNPTGVRVPGGAARAVAREARAAGVLLVSDESLAELAIDAPGPRPPSLAAGDPGSGVLAVGAVSKSIWGGLRTGWIRADRQHIRALALARGSQDVGSPVLDQLLAVEALEAPRRLAPGAQQAAARAARHASSRRCARPGGSCRPAEACRCGSSFPPGTAASALAARAAEHGVRMAAGPRFSAAGGFERRLRMPFTQPPERLEEAIRRLAAAEDALGSRPAATEPRPAGSPDPRLNAL